MVEGYPGGYFKGNRPLTRYEMAAIVSRAVKKLEGALADAQTAQKVNAADIAAVRRLVDEYGDQLKAVQKDVDALKTQVASNSATLDRQQFHLYYFLRAPGTYRDRVAGYSAAGAPLPTGAQYTGPNNGIGPQQLTSGETAHGTGFQTLRMVFSGNVDPKVSYAIRLENRYYLDNTNGNGGALGDSTSSATPNVGSFPNSTVLRINYASLTYKDPSGLYARAGRFVEGGGDIGLAYADYFNGGELGYASKNNRLSGFAGYSFNRASNGNAAPYNGLSSQSIFGRLADHGRRERQPGRELHQRHGVLRRRRDGVQPRHAALPDGLDEPRGRLDRRGLRVQQVLRPQGRVLAPLRQQPAGRRQLEPAQRLLGPGHLGR